jgi:hypothetical protein
MKTQSITQLLLAMLAVSSAPVTAQNDVPPPKSASAKAQAANTVTLNFAGGSMAEFVVAVRGKQPKANIVLAEQAQDAKVPPMVLTHAGIRQALEGACSTAAASYEISVKEFSPRGRNGVDVGDPVYSILARNVKKGAAGFGSVIEPERFIFSLKELIEDGEPGYKPLDAATILSAVELSMEGEQDRLDLKFHEDSSLLLAHGMPQHLSLISNLLSTLMNDRRTSESRQREYNQRQAMRQAATRSKKGALQQKKAK